MFFTLLKKSRCFLGALFISLIFAFLSIYVICVIPEFVELVVLLPVFSLMFFVFFVLEFIRVYRIERSLLKTKIEYKDDVVGEYF
jgi:hypothetical protein